MPPPRRLQQSLLLLLVFTTSVLLLACAPPVHASTIHEDGYCVMRGNCGSKRTFGKQLPCPNNSPAIQVCQSSHPPFAPVAPVAPVAEINGSLSLSTSRLFANTSSSTLILYTQHSPMHSCASCLFQLVVHRMSILKRAVARTRLKT